MEGMVKPPIVVGWAEGACELDAGSVLLLPLPPLPGDCRACCCACIARCCWISATLSFALERKELKVFLPACGRMTDLSIIRTIHHLDMRIRQGVMPGGNNLLSANLPNCSASCSSSSFL